MGNRPGVGDFGLFGQLSQLTHFDPDAERDRGRARAASLLMGEPDGGPRLDRGR